MNEEMACWVVFKYISTIKQQNKDNYLKMMLHKNRQFVAATPDYIHNQEMKQELELKHKGHLISAY